VASDREQEGGAICPFLTPVMADRLWLYPTGVYCRPPGDRVRVPAAETLTCICSTLAYLVCPRYLTTRDRGAEEATAASAASASATGP